MLQKYDTIITSIFRTDDFEQYLKLSKQIGGKREYKYLNLFIVKCRLGYFKKEMQGLIKKLIHSDENANKI